MLNVSRSIIQILFPWTRQGWNLRKCYLPLHLHHPSLAIMVASCVARILDADVGKTLMIMELLKFLRARTSARCFHRHYLGLLSVPSAMLWPFQTVNSLSIVGFFPSYQNHSQHLHFVSSLHRQCVILPWVSSISGDKQIHPLRCLQQGNPHHPSPSMPFYRPPPIDCCDLP